MSHDHARLLELRLAMAGELERFDRCIDLIQQQLQSLQTVRRKMQTVVLDIGRLEGRQPPDAGEFITQDGTRIATSLQGDDHGAFITFTETPAPRRPSDIAQAMRNIGKVAGYDDGH